MKIHLEIDISSTVYNNIAMEDLRLEIRRQLTGFIFKCAESVETPMGKPLDHRNITVGGSVKMAGFEGAVKAVS